MKNNNSGNMKMISEITEIINSVSTIIPLMQRNYKWTMECAAELSEDLWGKFYGNPNNKYQLNMITIYNDKKNNRLQILDGQQRIITLKLLLKFLEPEKTNFNFSFERDYLLDFSKSRKYFIENILIDSFFTDLRKRYQFSVDTKRLYNNFIAMLIPLSFRDIWELYNEIMQVHLNKDSTINNSAKINVVTPPSEIFHEQLTNNFIKDKLFMFSADLQYQLSFTLDDSEKLWDLCEEFNKQKNINEEDSNDEIRVSKYSQEFMELWVSKVEALIDKTSLLYIREKINNRINFVSYIKKQVEVLYHETTSEPIDEFLNINENKTRFVISDYIRSSMISDNPRGKNGEDAKNLENRKLILEVYKELANYLYNDNHKDIWELVKTRYDDFEKNKDINRLKILFSDKYSGTNTRGYVFETELKRLQYFRKILKELAAELYYEEPLAGDLNWNTYNAVYMLLECKKKYRFFNLFNINNIENVTSLKDVATREKFCFFELAHLYIAKSEDPWDISYFLESQLYDEKCKLKKTSKLPLIKSDKNEVEIENNEWCYVSRGEPEDELSQALANLVAEKKNTILV